VPTDPSSFVGREAELAAVERLVSERRLVTLTGPGGIGKTRLAVHLAAELAGRFRDGVWFVDLAPVADERLVLSVALTALGVAEDKHRDHRATLLAHLARRELALVLDSCEHVVDGAARLASEVLAACPGVHVVATSRELLAVPGEAIYRVPSLAAPDPLPVVDGATAPPPSVDDVAGFPAVRLFVERGRAAEPSFALTNGNAAAVAQICRRLDDRVAVARPRHARPLRPLLGDAVEALDLGQGALRRVVAAHAVHAPVAGRHNRRAQHSRVGRGERAASRQRQHGSHDQQERPKKRGHMMHERPPRSRPSSTASGGPILRGDRSHPVRAALAAGEHALAGSSLGSRRRAESAGGLPRLSTPSFA
jgi:hypothetical protein